jgi:aminoglycoside 6-adenylyltransferase
MDTNNPVIARLIEWGEKKEEVRAIILSSSRTNPNVQYLVDRLSDYDLDVVIRRDARAWYEDRSWLEDFGKVLVGFVEPPEREYGIEDFGCVILYQDGTKIDYTIMPVEIFKHVVAEPNLRGGWDDGYHILLDKDHLATGLKPPTHREYIPQPPTEQEYNEVIERFFTETTYVAKNLWRDELIFMKNNLDQEMKAKFLCRMLEWRMELDFNWSVRLGLLGKGLKKRLPPDLWAELENTYVGAGIEENWAALHNTIALFRKVAVEVGNRLGYAYLDELDRRVMDYLEKVKTLEH